MRVMFLLIITLFEFNVLYFGLVSYMETTQALTIATAIYWLSIILGVKLCLKKPKK